MAETATLDWVKTRFPLWTDFCDEDESALSNEIDMAIVEMNDFFTIEESDFDFNTNNALNIHLLNIIRKRCFDLKQSGEDFTTKPTIVKDYERTLKTLEAYQTGITKPNPEHDSDTENLISIDAKTRVFDEWFITSRGKSLTDTEPDS